MPNISSCHMCEKSIHNSTEQLAAKANQAVFHIDIDEESAEDDDDEGQADSDHSGSGSGEAEELSVEIESFQDDFPSMEQLFAEIWGWQRPVITLS